MCIECFEKLPFIYYSGNKYYIWQSDNDCDILFSNFPKIDNHEINTRVMSEDEIEKVKKKPLFLSNTIDVILVDRRKYKTYVFTIQAPYSYDGATICRFFWRVIGSNESIEFKVAALIHDVLCENHNFVNNDRYFADKVFRSLLAVADVNPFKRWLMFHCVDNFQKFCGWNASAGAAGIGLRSASQTGQHNNAAVSNLDLTGGNASGKKEAS